MSVILLLRTKSDDVIVVPPPEEEEVTHGGGSGGSRKPPKSRRKRPDLKDYVIHFKRDSKGRLRAAKKPLKTTKDVPKTPQKNPLDDIRSELADVYLPNMLLTRPNVIKTLKLRVPEIPFKADPRWMWQPPSFFGQDLRPAWSQEQLRNPYQGSADAIAPMEQEEILEIEFIASL